MADTDNVLTPAEAQAYYDRFGKKQDSQGFYEDPALDELIAHGDFANARSVFEFGCGTGKLAQRLLTGHLPAEARYLGCDISPVMLDLTRQRLAAYPRRAQAALMDGTIEFPLKDQSVDRVVCCYVLDLLSQKDIHCLFTEARRVLKPDGLLCLASLGKGSNRRSRLVASVWSALFRLNPAIVGGCRPMQLIAFADRENWQILHQAVVTPFGVPSEVLVLQNKSSPHHPVAAVT
jgi:SAM-dependent methyltransferase